MASLVFYLSATVLLAQSTVAFNCSKPPIYVDIHRRAVHESSEFQYGSFIGVGTPPQNHSLWPSLSQNHTSFGALGYCKNSTLRNCQDATGGLFVKEDSTSFKLNNDFKSLDTSRNNTFSGFFAQDTLRLYTHYFETDGAWQTLVEDSTIEVAEEGSIAPGIVGMGLQSTLLQTLVTKDLIAGRTYSLYIGQGFTRAGGAVNGSNTFGGYDAGRFEGPVHSYKMVPSNPNPLTVRVNDIIITNPDSTNVSLMDTSIFPSGNRSAPTPFQAEITTDQFPLSLPYSITQNLMTHLSAEIDKDNTWGDNSLRLRVPFTGTLSIVLEDGFTVTLPAEMLSNASNITPIQARPESSTAPFSLGSAFLSQVYLMADFDTYRFHLAKAVQKNNAVMPTTFCPKTVPVPYVPPKQDKWVKEGLIGAVVGGVLGGMGIVICAYCFIVAFLRKRDRRKMHRELERGRQQAKMAQLEIEEVVPEFDGPPKRNAVGRLAFWRRS